MFASPAVDNKVDTCNMWPINRNFCPHIDKLNGCAGKWDRCVSVQICKNTSCFSLMFICITLSQAYIEKTRVSYRL
jgi:hypothetical protein